MDHTEPVKVLYPGSREEGRISYEYANGIIMNHVGGNCLGLTFHGTEGELYVGRDGFRTQPAALKQASLGRSDIRLYHSNNHHSNWIDCIRSRRRCVADVEIGAHTATICHMGNIAYQLQRSLQWDPEKRRFIGDEAANRLLGRSMRTPWQI